MRKISIEYLIASFLMHNTWFSKIIPDKKYLSIIYKGYVGKKLNLQNPTTFNEKLQWLKLYDRNVNYTSMVDKYEVKKIIASMIGEEYIIPTLGVWDSFDSINFDELPNQFVLKCTHNSGGVFICKDKTKIDLSEAKKIFNHNMKKNFYYPGREWPYKDVKPRIIAEKYMEDESTSELRDYKFFTFKGRVKALFIASDRFVKNEETKFDFFDEKFEHLSIKNGHPNAVKKIDKPINFELMIKLAEKISKDIPHVRVDFYEMNGKVYFGEMTFFHNDGMVPFEPEEWDSIFGEWLILPNTSQDQI